MATSLTQFGITWTFDTDYTTGQYANGDYYVVAPSGLTITGISPASTLVGGRTKNGSMLNPVPVDTGLGGGIRNQGWDSAMYAAYGPAFDASLNVARPGGNDLSAGNPLVISPVSSLVSSISASAASVDSGVRPQLTDTAVLTVVSEAPAAGSFRPQMFGSSKTTSWNKSQLDYSVFRSLASVTGTPSLSTVEGYFANPWWTGFFDCGSFAQYCGPCNAGGTNNPSGTSGLYGRDVSIVVGTGVLSLHLNYSNSQKETLLVRLVQMGIDVYGAVLAGARYPDLGGIQNGRKLPLVVAALALNDANLKHYADAANHKVFCEDLQTWQVTAYDVGRALYHGDGKTRDEYITADIGIYESGEQHTRDETRDGRNWATYDYRDIIGSSYFGCAIGARLIVGGLSAWNWTPFFGYADRYELDPINNLGNPVDTFHQNMWDAYRNYSFETFRLKRVGRRPKFRAYTTR